MALDPKLAPYKRMLDQQMSIENPKTFDYTHTQVSDLVFAEKFDELRTAARRCLVADVKAFESFCWANSQRIARMLFVAGRAAEAPGWPTGNATLIDGAER